MGLENGCGADAGATRSNVIRQLVGFCMRFTGIGMAIGIVAAYGLTRFMSSMLYGCSGTTL